MKKISLAAAVHKLMVFDSKWVKIFMKNINTLNQLSEKKYYYYDHNYLLFFTINQIILILLKKHKNGQSPIKVA